MKKQYSHKEDYERGYQHGRNSAWIEIRDYAKNRLYESKKKKHSQRGAEEG